MVPLSPLFNGAAEIRWNRPTDHFKDVTILTLRSALQKFFPRIGPVSDCFWGGCTSIPRSLWEQIGGHALRCGVRGRCSLRNGTLAFEAAVAGLGTGRKCAFGATIGNCCKSTLRPDEIPQTRAKRDLGHSTPPQWCWWRCARCLGVVIWCAAALSRTSGGAARRAAIAAN